MKYVSKLCVSILISQFVIQISWIPCICIYWPLCLVYCSVESSWPYQGCRSVSSPAWTWRWWHRVPGLTSSHPTRRIPQSVEHTRTSGLESAGLEQREDVTLIRMSCIMWFPMSPMTLAITWHFVTNTDFYCAELFLTFRSGRVPSTNVIWLWIFLLTEGKKDYF